MLNLQIIHKPANRFDALQLLAQPGAAILAGGTNLLAEKRREITALVDVSALKLSFIETRGGDLAIGATTTLATVADSEFVRGAADGIVAQGAQRTHANILRNQATVAGTLIAEPDGIFAVVLSAMEARIARVYLENDAMVEQEIPIADFLARRKMFLQNALLTHITLPGASLHRRAAVEMVARTPRDKAIVSVCAALEMGRGIVRAGAIALGGVASHHSQRTSSRESDASRAESAWRARDAEREILNQGLTDDVIQRAAMAATSALNPRGDFRGSAEYRIEMVRVLAARALREMAK